MKNSIYLLFAAMFLALAGPARALDKTMAHAFAVSGVELAGKLKYDEAKGMLFKALANDEDCPDALFELGRIYESEGNTAAAANFFVRASRELAKSEKSDPTFTAKRTEADSKIKKLNPYAARMTDALSEYAKSLADITKKNADRMTLEEASDRVKAMDLETLVPNMPKIDQPASSHVASSGPNSGGGKTSRSSGSSSTSRISVKEVVNDIPPEVERALKSPTAGWTSITGTWKKKGEDLYEVTNGRLDAEKLVGGVQVTIDKGMTGSINIFVRNRSKDFEDYSSSYSSSHYSSGYGCVIKAGACRIYTPQNYYSGTANYWPYFDHEVNTPDTSAHQIAITIDDSNNLEVYVDGTRQKRVNAKMSKEGPFTIEIQGTATIKQPRAVGK